MVQIQDCVGWELPLKSWIQQILSPLAMPTTRLANRLYYDTAQGAVSTQTAIAWRTESSKMS
ncbi:MAG: hypothetical protein SW833_13330 [Cyanobacteriota bacterium]|nr:hypothetical protein [Cyanobacteriota bacterium]